MTFNTIFGGILATVGKSRAVPILKAFFVVGAILMILGVILIGIELWASIEETAYW